jgi:hypothetical protein
MLIPVGALVNKSVFELLRHGLERLFRDVQGARFHRPQLRFSGRLALGLDVEE